MPQIGTYAEKITGHARAGASGDKVTVVAAGGADNDFFCAGQRAFFDSQGAEAKIQVAAQDVLIVDCVKFSVWPTDRDHAFINLAVEQPTDVDVIGGDFAIIDQQVSGLITSNVNISGVTQRFGYTRLAIKMASAARAKSAGESSNSGAENRAR